MQRPRGHRCPCAPAPLRGPLYPYPHRLATYPPSPTDWPPLRRPLPSPTDWMAKGEPHPSLATRPYPFGASPLTYRLGAKGGGLATYGLRGAGFFFRTYPHYPFGVGGRAFRPASLKHFSHTNCPAKNYHRKKLPAGVFRSFLGFGIVKLLSPKELWPCSGTPPTSPYFFLREKKIKKWEGYKGGGIFFFFARIKMGGGVGGVGGGPS